MIYSLCNVSSFTYTLLDILKGYINMLKKVKCPPTGLQLHVQSVPITTNVVSSNPYHGEVYSIQQYVIKCVSDLRQVSGILWFLPQIKLTATI
jgi:hypothetical protein